MLIDFDALEQVELKNFNGGEKSVYAAMYVDERNRIMRGMLPPGASIGLHCHATGSEILYVLSGSGKFICEGAEEPLRPGICHYCQRGQSHTLINDSQEDLVFLAVVPQQP